jgi:hypothetical protein
MYSLPDSFRCQRRGPFITTIIDIADYKVGYIFSLWPITIIKVKVSKIMDAPRYVTFIKIFGIEYQKA